MPRLFSTLRARAEDLVRGAAGLRRDPPPRCDDPDLAYGDVDGLARVVHGDLGAMLIGGVASLYLQMLHPLAMAGVEDHSRYRNDPLRRLGQTAAFISATTFGSRETAGAAIDAVRRIHDRVHGVAEDGRPYDANDPHLLDWVHAAEIAMFLEGYRRFGRWGLRRHDEDRYVAETARVDLDLGGANPPRSVDELTATLASYRPELVLSDAARGARDFLTHDVLAGSRARPLYQLIVRASWTLLPDGTRDLLGVPARPVVDRWIVTPSARLLAAALRLCVPPVPRQTASVNPPSTAST